MSMISLEFPFPKGSSIVFTLCVRPSVTKNVIAHISTVYAPISFKFSMLVPYLIAS